MAQDLLADPRFADAVIETPAGWYAVDYGRLGFLPPRFAEMQSAGAVALRTPAG